MTIVPVFSQNTDKSDKSADSKEESSRTNGLKRLTPLHQKFEINEEELEANIERAIEHAMKSVDVALEKMEINLNSLDNLKNLSIDPIKIHIPNINIEPIEVIIPNIDIDMDLDEHINKHHDWSDDKDEKSKSDKASEKTKGLKKINP
jgi:hypothetical protein